MCCEEFTKIAANLPSSNPNYSIIKSEKSGNFWTETLILALKYVEIYLENLGFDSQFIYESIICQSE